MLLGAAAALPIAATPLPASGQTAVATPHQVASLSDPKAKLIDWTYDMPGIVRVG